MSLVSPYLDQGALLLLNSATFASNNETDNNQHNIADSNQSSFAIASILGQPPGTHLYLMVLRNMKAHVRLSLC